MILRPFIGPITGIKPTTHSAEESSTDKADPAEVKSIFPAFFLFSVRQTIVKQSMQKVVTLYKGCLQFI